MKVGVIEEIISQLRGEKGVGERDFSDRDHKENFLEQKFNPDVDF
jgi:hypothetical protein